MTNEEIVATLKEINSLKRHLEVVRSKRVQAEKDIAQKYQVEKCNKERNDSALEHQDQIDIIVGNIKNLEDKITQALG